MERMFPTLAHNATLRFTSRRSPVFARKGMVSSSQPLATEAGLRILRSGGNAIDAAIAVAAALAVLEPCSTGLGGDCFLLHYDASQRKVSALNGSGRCAQASTLERVKGDVGQSRIELPAESVHCVTVPGSAGAWADAIEKWGSLPLSTVLEPAAKLAEDGFPVSPITSFHWSKGEQQLSRNGDNPFKSELLVQDKESGSLRAPLPGEIFRNPGMAQTLRELGQGGKKAFYQGRPGRAIVEAVKQQGGLMEMQDLAEHETTFPEPIRTQYRGHDIIQVPPNGQGIAGLIALNVLNAYWEGGAAIKQTPASSFREAGVQHSSAQHMHVLIESMRLGFADARAYIADPDAVPVPTAGLLDPKYGDERLKSNFDPERAAVDVAQGSPQYGSDTVSFQVVDGQGNAVSMVNSNYEGFGSGIVPQGCGFTLQNRGANFSLAPEHPNALAPGKRPFHTIIPGLVLHSDSQELFATFTNMGGFMQPQGHLQLLCNMLDFGMDPQTAIDAPKFCIADGTGNGTIAIEQGVPEKVVQQLKDMGHNLLVSQDGTTVKGHARALFGRAQIIVRNRADGVLIAGSDGRADGCALGF